MKKLFLIITILISTISLYAVDIQQNIINPAQKLLGSPYRLGATGPKTFDCSGLINYLYKPYINNIPRVSRDLAKFGKVISRSEMLPGDLIFFATGNNQKRVTHVAIYIGQNSVIHAVSNGPKTGVIISKINSGYWQKRIRNSNRIFKSVTSKAKVLNAELTFERGKYKGDLINGEPQGQGSMLLKNGDKYIGEFKKGNFHGQGKYLWTNGDSYSGQFSNGYFNGIGEKNFANGEYLKASFSKGKAQGQGIYKWNSKTIFSGVFKNNKISEGWINIKGNKYWLSKTNSKYILYTDNTKSESIKSDINITNLFKQANKSKENYMFKKNSVWEKWDGNIYGDYDLWREKEKSDFEKWKEKNERGY